MNFVGVDIGASQTRLISETARIGVLPNNAYFKEDEELTKYAPYTDELEDCLEVIIQKNTPSTMFPLHLLYGTMAERYSHINVRPSVQEKKYKQKLSYASILVSAAASRINFGTPEKLVLYVAVPPVEVEQAEEAFREELIGDFTVCFPKFNGGMTVRLSIQDVRCKEESYMSTVSYMFTTSGQPKDALKKYGNSIVLSMNIGASTTDLAVIKNGKYLENSGKTVAVGGNIARDYLIGEVNEKYGFELPLERADEAMIEGRLKIGAKYENIEELVAIAKDVLAREIVGKLEYYFKSIGLPIQTMEAVIVSGGGSMQSQYVENETIVKTSEPMSYFVTKRLNEWCANVEVVEYGEEARLADLKGLFITAKFEQEKEKQAQAMLNSNIGATASVVSTNADNKAMETVVLQAETKVI